MAFTMHSHSGQFCPGHAQDNLEAIIQAAIARGYQTMGLSEHMPRLSAADLYPEELATPAARADPSLALRPLAPRHEAYLAEASRLQAKYAGRIALLVGFETDFVRPADYAPYAARLAADPRVDYVVGSLHHSAAGHPIDYSAELYATALAAAGSPAQLWAGYLDAQHTLLTTLQPKVVGHFDLPRLFGGDSATATTLAAPEVWARVRRNLAAAAAYGGWLECNTSALRKGLAEPYPGRAVAGEWVRLGGRFTLSDDSHGVAQLATHYAGGIAYLESLGVSEVWTLEREAPVAEGQKARLREKSVSLVEFRASLKTDVDETGKGAAG